MRHSPLNAKLHVRPSRQAKVHCCFERVMSIHHAAKRDTVAAFYLGAECGFELVRDGYLVAHCGFFRFSSWLSWDDSAIVFHLYFNVMMWRSHEAYIMFGTLAYERHPQNCAARRHIVRRSPG